MHYNYISLRGRATSLTSYNTFSWLSELGSESLNEMLKPIQHDKNIIPSTNGTKGANEVRVVRPCFRNEVKVKVSRLGILAQQSTSGEGIFS